MQYKVTYYRKEYNFALKPKIELATVYLNSFWQFTSFLTNVVVAKATKILQDFSYVNDVHWRIFSIFLLASLVKLQVFKKRTFLLSWQFLMRKLWTISGVAVRTTMDATITNQYCAVISRLADQARSTIRDLDPTNDITFLRIRSKKNEVLIAPGKFLKEKIILGWNTFEGSVQNFKLAALNLLSWLAF